MKKTRLLYAFVSGLALCVFSAASASSPGPDPGLLSLVPPGAAIVAEVTYGSEPTFLVLTRNNTADLMDLQAISDVDPTRTIARMVFVAARGSQGLVSEHSLLASGHFDAPPYLQGRHGEWRHQDRVCRNSSSDRSTSGQRQGYFARSSLACLHRFTDRDLRDNSDGSGRAQPLSGAQSCGLVIAGKAFPSAFD